MIEQSETISKIATAICKAQAQMGAAIKGAENPFFKSTYADLSSVIEVIKPAFTANDLSYLQFPISTDTSAGVTTRIMHSSGEWLESSFLIPCKPDAHGMGSAITYSRRYCLMSVAGIPTADDDGNSSIKAAPPRKPKAMRPVSSDDFGL